MKANCRTTWEQHTGLNCAPDFTEQSDNKCELSEFWGRIFAHRCYTACLADEAAYYAGAHAPDATFCATNLCAFTTLFAATGQGTPHEATVQCPRSRRV